MAGLPRRIAAARKTAGQTQAAIALACGVSRGAVAQWETSTGGRPDVQKLARFAYVAGVSVDWLLWGDAPPPTRPPAATGADPLDALVQGLSRPERRALELLLRRRARD
ncbi:putative transcriptional regulator [Dolichospermum phage Dfl-JY45]